ncbi:MAG: AAA family ATPase [Solirubrobacteraceae bacterium]
MSGGGFIRAVRLSVPENESVRSGYPWGLPAVAAVAARDQGLTLHPAVTYLIGENGSGKSTLLEAIAIAAGINPAEPHCTSSPMGSRSWP